LKISFKKKIISFYRFSKENYPDVYSQKPALKINPLTAGSIFLKHGLLGFSLCLAKSMAMF
jgi:hypothetical protein